MRARRLAVLLALGLGLLAGCGGSGPDPHVRRAAAPAPAISCDRQVLNMTQEVATRVYAQAASGLDVRDTLARLQRSQPLIRAVVRGDRAGTAAALESLRAGRIARVRVERGGRVLASLGQGPAVAPVSGALRDGRGATVGTFTFSVRNAISYIGVVSGLTGAETLLYDGSRLLRGSLSSVPGPLPASGVVRLRGQRFRVLTLPLQSYTGGPLQATLLVPLPSRLCASTAAQTRANFLGHAAENLYRGELSGPVPTAIVRRLEHDRALARAAAAGDAAGVRAAVVTLFESHLHVVRVRALRGSTVVNDVGGPAVLAPVPGTLRNRARRAFGSFLVAIQDDAGYVKLVRRFTGADVILRTGQGAVDGTLLPGPPAIPARGPVSYAGRRYYAYSFTGTAFPDAPLQISLLVPG